LKIDPISVSAMLISTFGVSMITLVPTPGSDVFAVFPHKLTPMEVEHRVSGEGLQIVRAYSDQSHIIVKNPHGDAAGRLLDLGADFVIDARFASLCSSSSTPQKNQEAVR
tara:strand:- start:47 stop:376 length:330 start_codon:yes stop_codon:yes gene_type:complete